jgi:hypothetical protein
MADWRVIRHMGKTECCISSEYKQNPTEEDFALLKEADTNLKSQKEQSVFQSKDLRNG